MLINCDGFYDYKNMILYFNEKEELRQCIFGICDSMDDEYTNTFGNGNGFTNPLPKFIIEDILKDLPAPGSIKYEYVSDVDGTPINRYYLSGIGFE